MSSSRPAKEFVQWVKTEIGISESTAYNYIKIHKNWLEVQGEDNYVSALKALRKSRKPKADVPAQVLTPWQEALKQKMEQFCIKASLDNMTLFLESMGIKEEAEQVKEEKEAEQVELKQAA